MTRLPDEDTIVAIGTAPGRAALAVVRMSGPEALAIAGNTMDPVPEEPRRATLVRVRDAAGEVVDQAIAICYRAPSSFTGEDVVEVVCHGGPMTSAAVTAALVARGARPAEPGEFTRRAVLAGKVDLLQAEAIGDLVDAESRAAQRVALSQLDGGLSRRVTRLRQQILDLEALCAYDIDFPEEDDGPVPGARILAAAQDAIGQLEALLESAPVGEVVRTGAVVVIAGAPNVGKSSLFNALLGRRRAIVTEIPGTTRDALEAVTEAGGWPIRLVDTAGLRETTELVEQIGIEVSRDYAQRADVVLVCGDTSDALRDAERAVETLTRASTIRVRTKADRVPREARREREGALWVSAESGEGLTELAHAIARALSNTKGQLRLDAPLVTRERQRHALQRARDELTLFQEVWRTASVPPVVAAIHLRDASRELEELIGAVDVEDVLDRLFASFCVGK